MKASDTEDLYDRLHDIIESVKVDGWKYQGVSDEGISFTNPGQPGIILTLSTKTKETK